MARPLTPQRSVRKALARSESWAVELLLRIKAAPGLAITEGTMRRTRDLGADRASLAHLIRRDGAMNADQASWIAEHEALIEEARAFATKRRRGGGGVGSLEAPQLGTGGASTQRIFSA